jgi:hypothetical protein
MLRPRRLQPQKTKPPTGASVPYVLSSVAGTAPMSSTAPGEPRVNVLLVNRALDRYFGRLPLATR